MSMKTDLLNITINNTTVPEFEHPYYVPVEMIVFLAIAYGSISLCAIIGNGVVLWIVVRSHRMRTVTNIFLANLAMADILVGALAIPFQFQSALLQRWLLPEFMCPFCPSIHVISVNVSIFTLTAIAIDRYRIVVHPLWTRMTKFKAQLVIVTIWALAILTAIPMYLALGVTMIPDDVAISKMDILNFLKNHTNISDLSLPLKPFCDNIGISPVIFHNYNRFLVAIQYFVPLILICGAYGRMALELYGGKGRKSLRRRDNIRRGNENARNNHKHNTNEENDLKCNKNNDVYIMQNRKKVLKMLFIVVTLFVLCWLPLQTYNLLQDFIPEINEYKYINIIWFFCHWLAMSNSDYRAYCGGVNPFVYAIYNLRN